MKNFILHLLKFILGFIALLAFCILVFIGVVFHNPTLIINPKNINFVLTKTKVLKSWSWDKGEINHQWIKWNHRKFTGNFQNLCVVYEKPTEKIETCIDKIFWNLDIEWKPKEGFKFLVNDPLVVEANYFKLTKLAEDDSPPPDYFSYWNILWKKIIPDLSISAKSIEIIDKESATKFNAKLVKQGEILNVDVLEYHLTGNKKQLIVTCPKKIKVPVDLKTKSPLYVQGVKLIIDIEESKMPLHITGDIEGADIKVESVVLKKWIRDQLPMSVFLENVALQTKGSLEIKKINHTWYRLMKSPYNVLPAPLNVLEGPVVVTLDTEKSSIPNNVNTNIMTTIDLKGSGQVLNMKVSTFFPFDMKKYKPGPILLGLDVEKLALNLPKLDKNKLPPQLKPDPRFTRSNTITKKVEKIKATMKKSTDLKLDLEAEGDNILQIKTNLLDEVLKLNVKLEIADATVQRGYIQALPLKTVVFKRKLDINSVRIIFKAPKEPEIKASIDFLLPEYTITLNLEGPLSKPRTAFSSKPPLPQDDIVAVLLFGRPLNDLDSDGKNATKKTNQIISQGILSLSVLYFFAGSPIQSIGYDPESNELSAQVGLGKRNSLRVSSEGGNVNGAGIRHSLGKGWYVDSTVQKSTTSTTSSNDYGVLLERIIAY